MDPEWTLSSSSWLWGDELASSSNPNPSSGSKWTREEDKAFENALALHSDDPNMWDKIGLAVPGKTLEDLKLHYEALVADVAAIESDKVPLPCYPDDDTAPKRRSKKKPPGTYPRRGAPWTDKEHREFISGLEMYGRGDWKSISRYCVKTKSNSQVASHAQKYFNKLKNAANKKRQKSNTIEIIDLENMPETPKPCNTAVPTKEASTSNWMPPPSPIPFGGSPITNQMITGAGSAPPVTLDSVMFDNLFVDDIMQEADPAAGTMQESSSTPDMMDVDMDMFILPRFPDI